VEGSTGHASKGRSLTSNRQAERRDKRRGLWRRYQLAVSDSDTTLRGGATEESVVSHVRHDGSYQPRRPGRSWTFIALIDGIAFQTTSGAERRLLGRSFDSRTWQVKTSVRGLLLVVASGNYVADRPCAKRFCGSSEFCEKAKI